MANFKNPRIRGTNERDIYRNYEKDYPRACLEYFMLSAFEDRNLETKDNGKSISFRKAANEMYYNNQDPKECIELYNMSLCYAVYNTENYAIILANRSAMLFALSHYKECLEDIKLCLQSKYPKVLRPKVYLRKCESYKKLGEHEKMLESAEECISLLDKELSKADAEKFTKKLHFLLCGVEENIVRPPNDIFQLPVMEPNPQLPNASASVMLKKDGNDTYYVSCKKITEGQVLFVEKAYTFIPYTSKKVDIKKDKCQYCLKSVINGVPCKTCVKYMFCSEACRNLAWTEFHQWECTATQADIFKGNTEMGLALRIIFKTFHGGFPTITSRDGYYTIDKLPVMLHNKELLQLHAENALLYVTYLKKKTNFFEYVKRCPNFCHKSDKELAATIGGLIIRHTSQMQSKALYISDYCVFGLQEEKIGSAVCPTVVGLSHSCDPNTIYYFYDDTVIFRALTDIDVNTKLTYSHKDITSYRFALADRKFMLWEGLKLRCYCPPCLNPLLNLDKMDSFICITCGGPAHILDPSLEDSQYKCLQCKNTFVMPFSIKWQIGLVATYLINFSFNSGLAMQEMIVMMSKKILNPYHKIYEVLYPVMMWTYSFNDDTNKLFEIFKLWIDYTETRYGVKSIENVSGQIIFSKLVVETLSISRVIIPKKFINILNVVNKTLKKVAKIAELFYPPVCKEVKLLKLQSLDLYLQMKRLDASSRS
ncbi:hypothetical protein RN001_015173 [Aquatica leii]|uniref:MYND-type domain-containing protein n=1 Tax=Aquatica leii TaxID=1421715 RepID=A0AAN7NYW0_9COLE|nr:hypothetical protein RN001_015173 [Aquatica leii]